MRRTAIALAAALFLSGALACGGPSPEDPGNGSRAIVDVVRRLDDYAPVRLDRHLGELDEDRRRMIELFIEAAEVMDRLFWRQAYGDRSGLFDSLRDPDVRRYAEINYGPWDRLAGNEPFIEGVGPKPPGANFYPVEMTREEFEAAAAEAADGGAALRDLYTLVRRDEDGRLTAVPYHEAYADELETAATALRQAVELASVSELKRYLELRAEALVTDEYRPSDLAWLDMKDNVLELVIGAIETYEDRLFGYKAAYEAFVLLKDVEWSRRLARYADFLPDLQRSLPVPEAYKREEPGTDADLNAYELLYTAGDGNAGSKTIAINLPNDEEVQLRKGTRRLQLKNAMRAKFDEILVPISKILIAEEQREHVSFDAFFANTMFHEVAHGLGIKQTVDGEGTVREALQDQASWMEEGKADVLGLWMITELHDRGELGDVDLQDYYVTFFSSIFRSIRFGTASAHGRANLVRYGFFRDRGAFAYDGESGTYRVEMEAMRDAVSALAEGILLLQGDGDRAGAEGLLEEFGTGGAELRASLGRVAEEGIPVDIVYEQGPEVLGLR